MSSTPRRVFRRRALSCLVAGALCLSATSAFARVAGANAYDVKAHISVAGLLTLDIAPIKQSLMTPQAQSFDLRDQLTDWSSGNAVAEVSASVLKSAVNFVPDDSQLVVGAEANAIDVSVSAVSLLGASLVSVSADAVESTSLISGQCAASAGAHTAARGPSPDDLGDEISNLLFSNGFDSRSLQPVNRTRLPGLHVSILGIDVPTLPLEPAPNTGIDLQALGIVGATLVLNEQTTGGDGTNALSMSSNAVHLRIDAAGLISADVTLGHADASVDCVH